MTASTVSMESACDYTWGFDLYSFYLSIDFIFPHITVVSEYLQKKIKIRVIAGTLPFIQCQGKMDDILFQLKLLLLAKLGDICMNYSWDPCDPCAGKRGMNWQDRNSCSPLLIAQARHLHNKNTKNKTNPFISQKQKPHSEVSSVLTLPRQLPYEQAMYCFYIRRQKGNRAVGWDTDCSGIRLGRFSGQLYVFPLLCVILLCAAWKRAIKQCGRDSKRRVSESFYSPLSDTYISAKA